MQGGLEARGLKDQFRKATEATGVALGIRDCSVSSLFAATSPSAIDWLG